MLSTKRQVTPPERPTLRLVEPHTAPPIELLSSRALNVTLAAALLLGALVRLVFVLSTDFPLNDGGMFYTMATDLQTNGYRIPEFTTYNFDGIPYAYPPLAFYAAAALEDLTWLSMFDVFRLLPLAINVATMGAFVLLARRFAGDRVVFAASVLAFVVTPRSFEWMIMGGGLTRSFGLLFAVLALHEFLRLYQTGRMQSAALAGLFTGLTALSHLEMAWFLAFSTVLFLAFEGRHRTGVIGTMSAGGIAATMTAIWWIPLVTDHGLSPFIAAASAGSPSTVSPVVVLVAFSPTGEPMFPVVAALALLGGLSCMSRKEWSLPLWVVACGLLGSRGFGNLASVPIALLAGIAVGRVIVPTLMGQDDKAGRKLSPVLPGVILGFLALYGAMNALIASPRLLSALDDGDRQAMHWVQANTPGDAGFLVVTDETWSGDRTSEWFPVLAQRQSVATVQGAEWRRGVFEEKVRAYEEVQRCADSDAACIERWRGQHGSRFTYVYLPKEAAASGRKNEDPTDCCAALRASLRASGQYDVVFDGAAATIFGRH